MGLDQIIIRYTNQLLNVCRLKLLGHFTIKIKTIDIIARL